MGSNAQLVYIYSLDASVAPIAYPRRPGRTIYIGHTKRETGAGRRFVHVSKSLTEGESTLINHSVSVYYHLGTPFHLRVFSVMEGRLAKDAELILLRAHLHTFGATPIGQGGGGAANTPASLSRLFQEQPEAHETCITLFEYAGTKQADFSDSQSMGA